MMIPAHVYLNAKLTPPPSSGERKPNTLKETPSQEREQMASSKSQLIKKETSTLLQKTPSLSQAPLTWGTDLEGLLSGSFPKTVQTKQNSLILTGKRKRKKISLADKENYPSQASSKRIKIKKNEQQCPEHITNYRKTFDPPSPHARKVLKPLNTLMAQGTDTKIMETRNPDFVVGINKGIVEQRSVEAYFNKYKSPHVMTASSIVFDGYFN